MRAFDKYDDSDRSDAEITLGTRSILGIFFALALVCGVFFGFGYSIGRGNTTKTTTPVQPSSTAPDTAQPAVKTVVEEPSPTSDVAESDPETNTTAVPDNQPSQRPASPFLRKPSAASAAAPVPTVQDNATPAVQPAIQTEISPSSSTPTLQKTVLPAYPSPVAPSAIMVQIAAVSHREDADVLISALKRLGYSASARGEASDNLLHVQVGPFATRDQANAMRTKLLNDGYNAILK